VKPEVAKPPPKVLKVGSLVILHGLKSAPELNEQKGEIEAWDILGHWDGLLDVSGFLKAWRLFLGGIRWDCL
jgi:hypothetical protein